MPMGCASSCRTFEIFSTAIEWVAKKHLSMPHLIHILDDYLMAAPTFHQCRINLDRFLSLCAYLGVPMAPEKTVGRETVLAFAGFELDTLRMEARLPPDKTAKCQTLISTFSEAQKSYFAGNPITAWFTQFCMLSRCAWQGFLTSTY